MTGKDRTPRLLKKTSEKKSKVKTPANHTQAATEGESESRSISVSRSQSDSNSEGVADSHIESVSPGRTTNTS